ncbi:hypothetical protein SAMN05216431_1219 [Ligilactobacillus sp. WC1T17]|uniref:Uncharacterized protein n=1 Tax=Ligilactobacillus ruminis TaxID=1623 RepID=A0ABY1AF01_9LACO|nr:hypothetical protein SAMN05216431_1219 [Ligilactobacillus ruminis]
MENENQVTETTEEAKATEPVADEQTEKEAKVDSDAVVKKLQKRIGAEQSKKNSYKGLTTLQFWRVVFGGAVLGKYDETEEKEVLFPRNAVFKVINWFQLSR